MALCARTTYPRTRVATGLFVILTLSLVFCLVFRRPFALGRIGEDKQKGSSSGTATTAQLTASVMPEKATSQRSGQSQSQSPAGASTAAAPTTEEDASRAAAEIRWYERRNTPSESVGHLAAELLAAKADPIRSAGAGQTPPLRSFSLLSSNPSQAVTAHMQPPSFFSSSSSSVSSVSSAAPAVPPNADDSPTTPFKALPPGHGFCTEKEQTQFTFELMCDSDQSDLCSKNLSAILPPFEGHEGLYEAVQALRSPGCFRTGQSISALGYHGTGSKLLFEVARLWLVLASERGHVASPSCARREHSDSRTATPSSTCTTLCHDVKVRGPTHFSDIFLMSHAKPRDSLCSRYRAGHFCNEKPSSWTFEGKRWQARCLARPRILKLEGVSQCHQIMRDQANLYGRRLRAGLDVQLDVHLDDYIHDPHRTVRAIGAALGICPTALDATELLNFLVERVVRRFDFQKIQSDERARHRETETMYPLQHLADCEKFVSSFSDDKLCRAWMDGHGSPLANAILGDDARRYS